MPGLHHGVEQIVLHLTDNAVCPLHKVLQHTLHLGGDLCLFALSGILQQIVIAVDDQQQHTGTGIGLFMLQTQNVGDFKELHRNDLLLIPDAGHGVYPIAQPIMFHQQVPVLIQCSQIQMDHVLDGASLDRAARRKTGPEYLIAPQDLAGAHRQNHRNGHALQRCHACALDLATDRRILQPFCPAQPDPLDTQQDSQQQDHQKLHGQKPLRHSFQHHTEERHKNADEPQNPRGDHYPILSFHAVFSFADSRFFGGGCPQKPFTQQKSK